MNAEEIRDMIPSEIQRHIDKTREDLFFRRFNIATRKLKNHQEVKALKRDLARLLTIQREREIEELYEAEIAALQASTGRTGGQQ